MRVLKTSETSEASRTFKGPGISMAADEVQVDLEASSMALERERGRERERERERFHC